MEGFENGYKNGYKNGYQKLDHTHRPSYEDIEDTANYLKDKSKCSPVIGIICGSGLGGLVDVLTDTIAFDYKTIPHFPISTAPGHRGRLVFGQLEGQSCVCMQGRVHMYEGYSQWKLTFPIRVMKLLGVKVLIATNAAGGLNPSYKVGDFMMFKDHINLPGMAGLNPLLGPNDERFGPRFLALNKTYDTELRKLGHQVARDLNQDIKEGVFSIQSGPHFETVSECKLLTLVGADVTGMSTVPEVMAAFHCGIRCFAMSLVTNMCITEHDSHLEATAEEVLEVGKTRSQDIKNFITEFVKRIDISDDVPL